MLRKYQSLITLLICFFPVVCVDPVSGRSPQEEAAVTGAEAAVEERVEKLLELMKSSRRSSPEKAVAYGREALTVLSSSGYRQRRPDVLNEMGWAYVHLNVSDSALALADRAKSEAVETGYRKAAAEAAYLEGRVHRNDGRYDRALASLREAGALSEQSGEASLSARIENEKGSIYRRRGNYEQALHAHRRALEINRRLDDKEGIADTYGYLGIIQDIIGNYDEALRLHQNALDFHEHTNDRRGVAGSLHNIGTLHQKIENYDEALRFYRRALDALEELGLENELATTINGIGTIEEIQGRYESALDHFRRAAGLWEKTKDDFRLAVALNNIGSVQKALGNYEESLDFHRRALEIRERLGDRHGMASSLSRIAAVLQVLEQSDEALAAAERSLRLAKEIGSRALIKESYETLSELYEHRGDYRDALTEYKNYKAAHDSLFNMETQSVITELQERYRTKEQKQHIALLERDQEIQRLWMSALAVGMLLLGLVAFLIFSRYRFENRTRRELERTHRELEQAHEELKTTQQQLIQTEKMATVGRLAAGISHEINNPNGAIRSSNDTSVLCIEKLDRLLPNEIDGREPADSESIDRILQILKANTKVIEEGTARIKSIVQGLKIFSGSEEAEFREADIHEGIESALVLLSHEFERRITVEKDYGDLPKLACFPGQLNQLFLSLLANAGDAIEGPGTITIRTALEDGSCLIEISDSGRGVPEEELRTLFDFRFSREGKRIKMGSGLITANTIVRRHDGEIRVRSRVGEGTTFTVILPVKRNSTPAVT